MKICSSKFCETKEPQPSSNFNRHAKRKDGLSSRCKKCTNKFNKIYYSDPRNKLISKEHKWKHKGFKNKHGQFFKLKDYYELMRLCNGCCEACGTRTFGYNGPHVDHDHKTGIVRGILCSSCNFALGKVYENKNTLMALISYLEKNEKTEVV